MQKSEALGTLETNIMRVLTVSVLLFMVLAHSVESEEAQAEVNVAVNGDVDPPAEEIVETIPDVPVQNPSLTESPELGDETPFTRSLGQCPFGWNGHQARCYHYVNDHDTWINAQQYCIGIGANLASARNPREYKFLQDMVHEIGRTSLSWLGGFYLQNTWLWMDGEGFYYSNWHSQSSASSSPCLYLRTTGGWSNSNCYSTRLPFICVKRTC
ncbi:hypothetical protein SKAU_G00336480 [Synaphobranchus kaupii]|uniref:C-type lectin domain-containing protein n=1 Tax=Synaphobranchus kaupii TaxID=118154 RepID=A0A9Q1IIS1_SYNKA|nr:hypothetical protein SKAU_G00336480 [Synaphobranchus kaupii]